MSDFRTVVGFEDVWRPPVGHQRRPETVLSAPASGPQVRARLARIIRRAPEVMVKITGRTRDAGHLAAHLSYITRNGELEADGPDGLSVVGRREVAELAEDWAAAQEIDSRRKTNSPFSVSLILSMPAGTDALRLRDSARAFARDTFERKFDFVLVLHTDQAHPHVHLTVKALGLDGARLNPKKADLEAWRQRFAAQLRDHGIEAEATPRRTRGVSRKSERSALRHLRQRAEQGRGEPARTRRAAYREAGRAAFQSDQAPRPWEVSLMRRREGVKALYAAQAALLRQSADPADRALGAAVETFVREMPPPDTQRLALARELRAANAKLQRDAPVGPDRPRSR